MDTIIKTKNLSQTFKSETNLGGTVCQKVASTGLWGSGKVTSRSTRIERIFEIFEYLSEPGNF